ncbi:MAG: HDOD domain-containing protein, partial [Chlorobia bacterium]|nr:HDOD domain-containing protein [Fimbriimonadaceae bacterium]
MDGIEFHQLVRTFQNVEALPQLPDSAIRLVQACDDDDATIHDAEVVVASDPGLTAMVIRTASTARFMSMGGPATTVSASVMRLGLRALKSLAMTHAFRTLLNQRHESDCYEAARFAKHSVFTGIATQYLFDREYGSRGHDLEEVFTFGLLHDLGTCLFANVAPGLFDECWQRAERNSTTFDAAFHSTYNEPLATLGWAAASAWNLPEIFVEFLHTRSQRDEPSDLQAVEDIVATAEVFAPTFGYAL